MWLLWLWECCVGLIWLFENVVWDYSDYLRMLCGTTLGYYTDYLRMLYVTTLTIWECCVGLLWLFENAVCDYSGWLHWLFEFLDDGPVQLVTEVLHCALVHFHYNRRRVVWKLSFRFGVTVNLKIEIYQWITCTAIWLISEDRSTFLSSQDALYKICVKLAKWFWGKKLQKSSIDFHFVAIISPLKKKWPSIWTNMNSLNPKLLC